MKILISADMEGLSGVVDWGHVDSSHTEYPRFCRIMTAEVNAAICGAFNGGADQILVADAHGGKRNIIVEELDLRAQLQCGSPSPLAMMEGVQKTVDAVILIGYHAMAGTEAAVLAHTISGRITNLRLNGQNTGEIGLNCALAGHFHAPVIMVSADQAGCHEAGTIQPSIHTVETKQAVGMYAARCLPPGIVQDKIKDTACKAVSQLLNSQVPATHQIEGPVLIEMEFNFPILAEKAAALPCARRQNGRSIEIISDDMLTAYVNLRSAIKLASS
ncbi:MAG: M55 family metallopeptidase [Anaerolineaceae bacterium]|nr:M55 family metallopeptidase [Anaerolineaceae bacterium]